MNTESPISSQISCKFYTGKTAYCTHTMLVSVKYMLLHSYALKAIRSLQLVPPVLCGHPSFQAEVVTQYQWSLIMGDIYTNNVRPSARLWQFHNWGSYSTEMSHSRGIAASVACPRVHHPTRHTYDACASPS